MSDPHPRRERARPTEAPARPRDTARLGARQVLFGGGAFDVSGEHQNQKGWDIFELGQRSFWAVPDAIDWSRPIREDPEHAEPIAAMLEFLCPGEKAAVTGASLISSNMQSEEAQFYFAEQALEEAKHYDAMRRVVANLRGRPMDPPPFLVRLLYSFGVIDRDDTAFMMGSINIIGEHLAHQILHKIRPVATDPQLIALLTLIGKDESRHIAAGKKFFPEVFPQFKKNRRKILAKNLATTIVVAMATYHLINPMQKLDIDVADIMEAMYQHYSDVTHGFPAFPEQALLDTLVTMARRATPLAVRSIRALTTENGELKPERLVAACERALTSPRALREILAA